MQTVVDVIPSQLAKIETEYGLPPEQASNLLAAYAPSFAAADAALAKANAISVTDATQVQAMKEARAARLALKDIRVAADKIRKNLKEESLRTSKAIDGTYNVLLYLIEPAEKRLEDAEKFAEREEARRVATLHAERSERARVLGVDPTHYQFGTMNYETWTAFVETATLAAKARADAAKKAEEERAAAEKAAAEERQRVAAENARLRAEAEAARVEAARKATEEAAARAEIEKAARLEREKREAAEREAAALRQAAEDKARAEREAAEKAAKADAAKRRAEAKAPDKTKAKAYAVALARVEPPLFTGPDAAEWHARVTAAVSEAVRRIEALAND